MKIEVERGFLFLDAETEKDTKLLDRFQKGCGREDDRRLWLNCITYSTSFDKCCGISIAPQGLIE